MTRAPSRGTSLVLSGTFDFTACAKNYPEIKHKYQIEISVPTGFPRDVPKVKETNGKIPRNGHYHVNHDDTLCLGSPLQLLIKLNTNTSPTLTGFASKCLVPYLYAVSHKLLYGGKFIFDELSHGVLGILDDYQKTLGLETSEQTIKAIKLIGTKKRIANKKLCPCNCGNRLGVCSMHYKLNKIRTIAPRSWFTGHAKKIEKELKEEMGLKRS